MIPTGRQTALRYGDFTVIVTELGATLRELTFRGRRLIAGFAENELPTGYRGAVLAPWPNRLADGHYRFSGQAQQLPLTEPDRRNALHGLVCYAPWQIQSADAGTVRLTHRLWPQPGYPHLLDLATTYRLDENGLTFTLTAVNAGDMPAPYGSSFHPYLTAGTGTIDDWTVHLPASSYLTVDPVRLLPKDLTPAGPYDFRKPTGLRGIEVDHAFTDIAYSETGFAALTLTDPHGQGVRLTWDRHCPWLQLCTPGPQHPDLNRRALAVEPMTCPPDAFNTGVDLITLQPGDQHRLKLTISPIR